MPTAPGADPATDEAIERFPKLRAFIQQGLNQPVHLAESIANLNAVLRKPSDKGQSPGNLSPLAAEHGKR